MLMCRKLTARVDWQAHALNQVGLTEQADKRSRFLSGGMRRRLSMGTLLMAAMPCVYTGGAR
jgi:ABC-type multidrug transport system ATPase subunit